MSTKITFENYTDYPVGTEIEFHFGAYYPKGSGRITGSEILAASKFFPAEVRLTAEYIDVETEQLVETTVTSFTDVGIGTYLIKTAEPNHKKVSTKWS